MGGRRVPFGLSRPLPRHDPSRAAGVPLLRRPVAHRRSVLRHGYGRSRSSSVAALPAPLETVGRRATIPWANSQDQRMVAPSNALADLHRVQPKAGPTPRTPSAKPESFMLRRDPPKKKATAGGTPSSAAKPIRFSRFAGPACVSAHARESCPLRRRRRCCHETTGASTKHDARTPTTERCGRRVTLDIVHALRSVTWCLRGGGGLFGL
jgi:hypothetical protein